MLCRWVDLLRRTTRRRTDTEEAFRLCGVFCASLHEDGSAVNSQDYLVKKTHSEKS